MSDVLIADSHEFIELYRGDKDIRLGQEMLGLRPDLRFVSFAPRAVSPIERRLLGTNRLTAAMMPELPERMELGLLPSVAVRFASKEIGGVVSFMPGYGRALKRLHPDIIIENPYTWLTPRSYTTDRVARRLGVPVVYYDPGDDVPVSRKQRLLRPLETPVVNRAAAIITYNEVGRRRFMDKYGYPSSRIHVIPKPVDVPRWQRPDLRDAGRAALGIPPDTFVVAHVGRLTHVRGSMVLAEAARQARGDPRFAGTLFVFIGGPLGSDVDVAAYEGPNTIVTGMLPNQRVPGLISASDAIVFPDLATKAGFTTAIAEAMAAGKPLVVGADAGHGGVPLTHDVNCLYVRAGSPTAILEAVASLVSDPARATGLGKAVGGYALEHMDYPRVAGAYLDILEGLVSDGRPT
ncbi:MAG: glycosyltransferase family 4 protein [Coriobacteriia bacterium]